MVATTRSYLLAHQKEKSVLSRDNTNGGDNALLYTVLTHRKEKSVLSRDNTNGWH